ncbi:BlaI family penicillinase repressor [Aequitasia blattaphilus]|uniref:BlaI/MecI/CopY family transcriptional regulator n=1 Tax=Aequitasia blattaphilus TaxID=2949332 RepID=A0ABT1EBL4_9FIRM|nr:BlaI/MecI/CopY family transcriptional regulator [Aequitasia blattaphilus]MCP1103203.1 BlaI/MecI/CopY family transcriptional regulator [Aequitasia blattaphilus]MCR8615843.1 BlaI/MecI/CopY family transcriptional regulator [Aequitasia blattaphilus]
MSDLPHITQSEWNVMKVLWKKSPLTIMELVKNVQAEQKLVSTTVKTLLRRLIAKDAVGFTIDEKNSKLYYYFPLVTEEECVKKVNKQFLKQYHQDNVENLFATFVNSTDLSGEEIDHLRALLEQKKAESNE